MGKRKWSIEKICEKFPKELVPGQTYVNDSVKLQWFCLAGLKHGKFFLGLNRRLNGRGCQKCGMIRKDGSHRLLISDIEKRFSNELIPEQKYSGSGKNLLWRCLAGLHPNYLQSYRGARKAPSFRAGI